MEPSSPPSRDELLALLRKYDAIAALRRDRAKGAAAAERGTLRALAKEFPGALRELDTLALTEIARRRRALSRAARGGAIDPWMAWMIAYHATMRAALVIKAKLGKSRPITDATMRAAIRSAVRLAGVPADRSFVESVARPPQGRLNVVVFERLGQKFARPPDEIWQALFPARRAGRF